MDETPLALPTRLSPSKVSTFLDCGLKFQFNYVDKIETGFKEAAERGTLAHSTLERLMTLPPEMRDHGAAMDCFDIEKRLFVDSGLGTELAAHHGMDPLLMQGFYQQARDAVTNLFRIEDPSLWDWRGIEMHLEAKVEGVTIRGIVDILTYDDGWIISDYKSGAAPSERYTQSRLLGLKVYALLFWEMFGELPIEVRLLHLGGTPKIISIAPTEQNMRATRAKIKGVWDAMQRAADRDDFRPKTGPLCNWCDYRAICPTQQPGEPT